MLKKSYILFFAMVYFIASSGFTINTHFCGGKLKTVSLFNQAKEGCCSKKTCKKGCCQDSKSFIKVKDVQESNNNSVLTSKQIKIADFNSLGYAILSVIYSSGKIGIISKKVHDHPILYKQQIFIEFHSLLI